MISLLLLEKGRGCEIILTYSSSWCSFLLIMLEREREREREREYQVRKSSVIISLLLLVKKGGVKVYLHILTVGVVPCLLC